MATAYIETEIEVDLEDFDTDDLLDELERRGSLPVESAGDAKETVEQIYHLRRQGQAWDHLMDRLIYQVMGRVA